MEFLSFDNNKIFSIIVPKDIFLGKKSSIIFLVFNIFPENSKISFPLYLYLDIKLLLIFSLINSLFLKLNEAIESFSKTIDPISSISYKIVSLIILFSSFIET